jgi:excisionase family DNA binding protein
MVTRCSRTDSDGWGVPSLAQRLDNGSTDDISFPSMASNEGEVTMPTYTIKQVAAELQVSIPTVERWIKAKKINVVRLGYRTIRITDKELDRIKTKGLR